jgi:outer membrane protein OmpA-like peptidoglycan-associated protein
MSEADDAAPLLARPLTRPLTRRQHSTHLHPVFFRFESDELTDESRALLPQILQAVKDSAPFPDVAVVGHTDTTGRRPGNKRARAEARQCDSQPSRHPAQVAASLIE